MAVICDSLFPSRANESSCSRIHCEDSVVLCDRPFFLYYQGIFELFIRRLSMKEQIRVMGEPYSRSRSTLLIPGSYHEQFFNKYRKVRNLPLSLYLHRLLNDPLLDFKLSFLKVQKWKKQYQADGQDLRRVNFYPDERDWARLSAISNATGFSRCYIFVFLMLGDMGVISLDNGGTKPYSGKRAWNPLTFCSVLLDSRDRKLTRNLQI